MSDAQGLGPEHEQNPYATDDAWNTMRTAQAGAATNVGLMAMSPEDKERHEAGMAEYRAHQKRETDRSARATALDLAIRCAQPGSHADVVIEDARKFFEWLADAT